jgi:hypothetical protein
LALVKVLTLAGIPPETFQYRLGNRSALEWVIDQYQVTEDKKSGIRSDPNRENDPEYIVAPRGPGGPGEPGNRAAGFVSAAARGCLMKIAKYSDVIAPLYERRKTPVADRRYSSGRHCILQCSITGCLRSPPRGRGFREHSHQLY